MSPRFSQKTAKQTRAFIECVLKNIKKIATLTERGIFTSKLIVYNICFEINLNQTYQIRLTYKRYRQLYWSDLLKDREQSKLEPWAYRNSLLWEKYSKLSTTRLLYLPVPTTRGRQFSTLTNTEKQEKSQTYTILNWTY